MATPLFSEETFKKAFGLTKKFERDFVDDIVVALGRLDRALLPPPASHPMATLIAEGPRAVDRLLALVERGSAKESADAADALAQVLAGHTTPTSTVERLRAALQTKAGEAEFEALLAKTLAISGDQQFLTEQLLRLADDDPGVVATAARLLGFGRATFAVPALMGLVSPERFFESRWVIWALGEIGDARALPALEIALANAFRVVDCLIAIGKIGRLTSIPHLTPHITGGFSEQKDAAVRALAMILDNNRDGGHAMGAVREQLGGLLERDLADPLAPISTSIRFHMLLCLARLGVHLDAARVKKYLGVSADARESPFARVAPAPTRKPVAERAVRPKVP